MKKTLDLIIENIEANKDEMEFLPTGFAPIDEHLDGGFLRKELVVLGGKTGLGKSYVAGQILWNLAQKGFNTAYFSLEISNEMIVSRLIGALSNLKPTRIMCGRLLLDENLKKVEAKAKLLSYSKFMSFYDDTYDLDEIIDEIKSNKFEFVVIDFIQNIFVKNMDEYTRLSFAALALQKAAKELNCCILLLSQLSNLVVREGNNAQVEFKGSGNIATVADLAFFMERIEGFDDSSNPLRLKLRKNRRGILGNPWEFTFQHPGGFIQ